MMPLCGEGRKDPDLAGKSRIWTQKSYQRILRYSVKTNPIKENILYDKHSHRQPPRPRNLLLDQDDSNFMIISATAPEGKEEWTPYLARKESNLDPEVLSKTIALLSEHQPHKRKHRLRQTFPPSVE